jgi:hypothetical protein
MNTLLARREGHGQPVKKPTWKGGEKKLSHKVLQKDLYLLDEDWRTHTHHFTTSGCWSLKTTTI